MQHLSSDLSQRVLCLGPGGVDLVPDDGVMDQRQVFANLVGPAGVDFYEQVTGHFVDGQDPLDARDRGLSVDRTADLLRVFSHAPQHDGVVDLQDPVVLEQRDNPVPGRGRTGKQIASGGVAVQTVDGNKGGDLEAVPEQLFEAVRAVGDHSGRFIDDNIVVVLEKDAGKVLCPDRAVGRRLDFNLVAGHQDVPGHPDPLVVDEYDARIQQGFGLSSGQGQSRGQKVQQRLPPVHAGNDKNLRVHGWRL